MHRDDLREHLAREIMEKPVSALTPLQRDIIEFAITSSVIPMEDDRTFLERLADRVAAIGGSWGFIFGFMAALVLWAGVNILLPKTIQFDPYPFIFLNLILSMIAALQAPVIMMSQNRQAERDRTTATNGYKSHIREETMMQLIDKKLDIVLATHGVDSSDIQIEPDDLDR